MKVLVTGAGGQLGLDLLDVFADVEVLGLTRAELDITSRRAVRDAVGGFRPDVVVNAAAWTAVDACESDPDKAHRVNAFGAQALAMASSEVGATIVQVSTDYVFPGDRPADDAPLTEDAPVAPINVYGASKLRGEQFVAEACAAHHVVRTAWLCGARGANFVRTMLRLADDRPDPAAPRSLSVVDDQVGSPTFTRDLAAAIRALVDTGAPFGTWHLAGSGRCSWHDLAAATFELAGREVDLCPISSSAYPLPAARPAWSVLASPRARAAGLAPLPDWRDGLRDLLAELGELAAEGAAGARHTEPEPERSST